LHGAWWSGSYQGSPANMLRGQAGQLFSIIIIIFFSGRPGDNPSPL